MVLFFLLCLFTSGKKAQWDKGLLLFAGVVLASTVFSANRGISVDYLRGVVETLIIFSVIKTFLVSEERLKKLFGLYVAAFLVFGVWGISSGGKISSFQPLGNEDSYGPFMSIGIGFAYYLARLAKGKMQRIIYLMTLAVCLLGVVVSFARGTFLSGLLLAAILVLRSESKGKWIVKGVIIGAICLLVVMMFAPDYYTRYTDEVATIWEMGTEEDTANDRVYLWTKAWEMFLDHPLIGVGPGCFGFQLPKYSDFQETQQWGVTRLTYGRAIHNIYFEILSELGFLGIAAFLLVLVTFSRANSQMVEMARASGSTKYLILARALEAGMVALLANGFFYNMLIVTWFWDLCILNAALMRVYHEEKSELVRTGA
jgi:O-antigen ligase